MESQNTSKRKHLSYLVSAAFVGLVILLTGVFLAHKAERDEEAKQQRRTAAADYCLKHPPKAIQPADAKGIDGNTLVAEEQALDFTIRQCNIALGKEEP